MDIISCLEQLIQLAKDNGSNSQEVSDFVSLNASLENFSDISKLVLSLIPEATRKKVELVNYPQVKDRRVRAPFTPLKG